MCIRDSLKLCSPHKDSLQNVQSPMHPNFKNFLLHAWLDFQLPPWPPQLYFFASKFFYKTPIETGSGPSWAILAPTWTSLGPTLAAFGPTWANLVPNWQLTWSIWGQSEPTWHQLGSTWDQIWPTWWPFETELCHFGTKLC